MVTIGFSITAVFYIGFDKGFSVPIKVSLGFFVFDSHSFGFFFEKYENF